MNAQQADHLRQRFEVFTENRFARECARILRDRWPAVAAQPDVVATFLDLAERLEREAAESECVA